MGILLVCDCFYYPITHLIVFGISQLLGESSFSCWWWICLIYIDGNHMNLSLLHEELYTRANLLVNDPATLFGT